MPSSGSRVFVNTGENVYGRLQRIPQGRSALSGTSCLEYAAMVIRKPVPTGSTSSPRQTDIYSARPEFSNTEYNIGNPYAEDISPWEMGPQQRQLQKATVNGGLQQQHGYTSVSDGGNAWIDEDSRQKEVRDARQSRPNPESTMQNHRDEGLPSTLRIGSALETPRTSSESQGLFEPDLISQQESPQATNDRSLPSTNPYHRARSSVHSNAEVLHSTADSSVNVWADLSSVSSEPKSASPPRAPISVPLPYQSEDTSSM